MMRMKNSLTLKEGHIVKKNLKFLACLGMAVTLMVTPVFAEGPTFEPQGKLDSIIKQGDVNNDGDINAEDVLESLKVISGIYSQQKFHIENGDISEDGKLSIRDALTILQNIAGISDDKIGYEKNLSEIKYEIPESYKDGSEHLTSKEIAFYGADGWGKYTTGGRKGEVIEVTNLKDSGEGSFRAAVEAKGARIIVFKVSGVIYLNSGINIRNGNVTIAGETAPGDGITLANCGLGISGSNVIVRYLTIRPGDQNGAAQDAIDICAAKNVVVDHCSVSFATDETLSARPSGEGASYDAVSDNVSVQWCMISESIAYSPTIGERHGMGSLIRGAQGAKITYHHNMYSSHSSRNPMMGNYMTEDADKGNFSAEFINNVVYNWSGGAASKCADADENGEKLHVSTFNYINNYYKAGPESTGNTLFSEGGLGNHMYISGNMMNDVLVSDQKTLVGFTNDVLAHSDNPYYVKSGLVMDQEAYFLAERFANSEMENIDSAETVGKTVPEYVGNSLSRDCFDTAVVDDFYKGEGRLINQTFEAAGWYKEKPETNTGAAYKKWIQDMYPEQASYPAYEDSDHDGMSDEWEDAMGLDKNKASDGAASYKDSAYTNLDVFLQFLVENPEAAIKH